MNRPLMLALVLGTWLLQVATAHAQIAYSYVADASSYGTTGPSSSVTVTVYLQEVLKGVSTSLVAADGGLFSAGVLVSTVSGSTVTVTSAAVNSNFTTPTGPYPLGSTGQFYGYNLTGPAAYTSGPTSTSTDKLGTTTNLYALGTFTLTGSSTSGVTTFGLSAVSGSNGNYTLTEGPTASGSYYDLDITNGGSGGINGPSTNAVYSGAADNPTTFTVNNSYAAVPEPGSMALCSFAACALGVCAWRRRKGQTTQEESPIVA